MRSELNLSDSAFCRPILSVSAMLCCVHHRSNPKLTPDSHGWAMCEHVHPRQDDFFKMLSRTMNMVMMMTMNLIMILL